MRFEAIFRTLLRHYDREHGLSWLWTAMDSPDIRRALPTLDAVVLRTPSARPMRPIHLCLDKGHDYPSIDRGLYADSCRAAFVLLKRAWTVAK